MTAASTGHAVAAFIGTLGIQSRPGVAMPVAVGQVRPGLQVPYILVQPTSPAVREAMGDYGDPGSDDGITETLQVDYVYLLRAPEWAGHDETVVDTLMAALTGCRLPDAPHRVYGVTATDAQALPVDPNLGRTAISVRVRRSLRRKP